MGKGRWFCWKTLVAGDTQANIALRRFISFDITELDGVTVESAQLDAEPYTTLGNCALFCPLWVISVY